MPERLLKWLAQSGALSRRKADAAIREGRVKLNEQVVTDPTTIVDGPVELDGEPVTSEARQYFVLHKPVGVISTAEDTHDRPIVTELVPASERLYPVGRLDADSSGLMLLTNDGELANRLTHPRYEIPKTYQVEVRGSVSPRSADQLSAGVKLEDGLTAPAEVRVISSSKTQSVLEFTIREGRNRQIRRMCEAVGHPVERLVRQQLGVLKLGTLKAGAYRRLTTSEVHSLRKSAGLT